MATGILSEGIKLSYKKGAEFIEIENLQEVPELGGTTDKVEVTTLTDSAKKYINGIKDYGDLEFTFLYDNSSETANYRVLQGLEASGSITEFKIDFPDETSFAFSASVTTKVAGAKVNDALTFSAAMTLNTKIEVTNPA